MKSSKSNKSGTVKVDKNSVPCPVVNITNDAGEQLQLILENDYTLEGQFLRLVITGKGCDGFTYSTGFTECKEDDFRISSSFGELEKIIVLMDPFTAFYLQESTLDYVRDYENNDEGFVITSHHQDNFKLKFWNADPDKTPKLQKQV